MEDTLKELLESFGFPVYRQGSLPQTYPDSFFTFWNTSEDGLSFYDNLPVRVGHSYDVNFYSTNPQNTYDYIRQARSLLEENGWTIPQRGYDLASDEPTHTGRGMEVVYQKNEQEE